MQNRPMEGDVVAVVYLLLFPKGIEQIGQMAGAGVRLQEVSDEGFLLLHIACQQFINHSLIRVLAAMCPHLFGNEVDFLPCFLAMEFISQTEPVGFCIGLL